MQRLYLQYRPTLASLNDIERLQAELAPLLPDAKPVSNSQLHVTLIHFGILQTVFDELHAVNPRLDYTAFQELVERFADRSENKLPASAILTVNGYELFGTNSDVLVLRLDATTDLITAHQSALQELRLCLEACGIPNVEKFMAANHNFQYALGFRPHLTLYKKADTIPVRPPKLKNLQLTVMPTRYD